MLEDVVHGNDVVLADMTGQIGVLQGAFEDVVAPGPAFGRYLGLDLDARALQIEEPTQLVEVTAVAAADVKEMAGTVLDEATIESGSGPCPGLHEQPGDATVVLVVGVVVVGVEGGKLGLGGAGVEEFRFAPVAFLDDEGTGRVDEILEILYVGPVDPGLLRAADGARGRCQLLPLRVALRPGLIWHNVRCRLHFVILRP